MPDTPTVIFRAETDGSLGMRIGYLVVINSVPWAFSQPNETDPLKAQAIQLDPSLLKEVRDTAGALLGYSYRGVVVVIRDVSQTSP
jgi:hypothetical protein